MITSYNASRAVAWEARLLRRLLRTFNRSGTTEMNGEASLGWSLICWRTLEMKRNAGGVRLGKEAWCLRAVGTSVSNWVIEESWELRSETRWVMTHKRWIRPEADWQSDPLDFVDDESSMSYSSQTSIHYSISHSLRFHSSNNRPRPLTTSLRMPRWAASINTSTTSFTTYHSPFSQLHPFTEYPWQILIKVAVCSSMISYSAQTIGEEGDIYPSLPTPCLT